MVVIRGGNNFLYGEERDRLLARQFYRLLILLIPLIAAPKTISSAYRRTKIVLNPQLHPESKEFKWVRLFYLLAYNKFVLSEPAETAEEAQYRDGMAFAAAKDFPQAILKYLKNETGRHAVARRGMHEFQQHSSGSLVQPAVQEFIRRECKEHRSLPPLGMVAGA